MNVADTIISFIDKIFNPPISFLNLSIERIEGIKLVIRQGIDVSSYLSVFGDMPNSWQLVISSLLISVVMLSSLIIFRSLMRMFYAVKEGVTKWFV